MVRDVLIYDLETDSIDISTAKLKFFGAYSYMTNEYYLFDYTQKSNILELIQKHRVFVSFNGKAYDNPILENNGYVLNKKIFIDLYEMSAPRGSGGVGKYNKNKLAQMGVEVKRHSLKAIVDKLKLDDDNKGDIDYKIFQKDEWTKEELAEIYKYLKKDIELTKKLFEWYESQFAPLKIMLPEASQRNYKHLTSTLSSLAYEIICNQSGLKVDYGEKGETRGESYAGGHHIEPRWEKAKGLIYNIDFTSAYPNSILMGNLLSHAEKGWSGDNYYKIKGTYNDKDVGKIEQALKNILLERLKAKKAGDKVKSQGYKIVINSFYGSIGNPVFKSLYNHTTVSDCTSIVRTWLKKLAQTLEMNGFVVLYGFTDNVIVKIPTNSNKEELIIIIDNYMKEIKSHMPFPLDTFNLEIETEMKFIWFVAKNCYLYVTNKDEVKYKSTLLNTNTPKVIRQVFDEYMKPKIISELDINFTEKELIEQIKLRLQIDLELSAEEHKVIEAEEYKVQTSLQYQIAERYGSGTHFLIPNISRIGVGKHKETNGKTIRYCSIDEFKEKKLTVEDISLNKLLMHLKPFFKQEVKEKNKTRRRDNTNQKTLFEIKLPKERLIKEQAQKTLM